MKNSFKKINSRLFKAITLVAFQALYSCQDEEVKELPTSVIQFNQSQQNVTEGLEATITLLLTDPASMDGSVVVSIETNAVYNQDYFTNPEPINSSFIINIVKGQKETEFKVSTRDDPWYEKAKSIKFKLSAPSPGIEIGITKSLTLTIDDDEGPSLANFTTNTSAVIENDDNGVDIKILFSTPAKGEGTITLTLNSGQAIYGINYTTFPTAENNSITYVILPGQEDVSVKVLPINDEIYTGNFNISFSITSVSGVIEKGNNLDYSLVIIDDELVSFANFATNSGIVHENDVNGIVIEIPFSKPVDGEGTIKITMIPYGVVNYGQDFITQPSGFGGTIELRATENQSSVSFKILPIDNSISNYYKLIQFKIIAARGAVSVGAKNTYDLTIIDDEIAEASFVDTTGTISESASAGIVVKINFSKPLSQTSQFVIGGPDQENLNVSAYSTSPELVEHSYYICPCDDGNGCYYCDPILTKYYDLPLVAQQGTTSLEFTINPVDNLVRNGNGQYGFRLTSSPESPTLIVNGRYTLTIVDDD